MSGGLDLTGITSFFVSLLPSVSLHVMGSRSSLVHIFILAVFKKNCCGKQVSTTHV